MKHSSLFSLLSSRNLSLYLLGTLVSFTGSYMQIVGIAYHVYQITHSAFFLGLLGLVGFVPTLFVFLPAGVIVDKSHKKDILLFAELLLGIFAIVLFLTTQFHVVSVWVIFLMLFLSALVNALETPARHATIPLLVPEHNLSQALNLQTLSRQTGAVVGPAISGFIIALYGVQSIYLLNALSFFFFFVMIIFITIPRVTAAIEVSKDAIVEGLLFIRHNSLIAITMLLDFFATFFAGAMVLLPVLAREVYHVNPQGLGLLYASPSFGAIVAGVYLSIRPLSHMQGKILIGAIIAYAFGTIALGLFPWFLVGCIALAIIGAGDMISTVIRNIIRQKLTPPTLRGRVLSVIMVFFMDGPYLGDAEAGFVAGIFGAPVSVVIGGITTLLLIVGVAWKSPSLRNYEDR